MRIGLIDVDGHNFSNLVKSLKIINIRKCIVETGTLPVLHDSPRAADDDRRER